MLDPSDIVSAKILHQLGLVALEELRGELRALRADPGAGADLVARLLARKRLAPPQASLVRRCSARFQVVLAEAAFLKELQWRGLEPAEEVELLAAVEADGHGARLAAVVRERRCLDSAALWEAEEAAQRRVRAQFTEVVSRYARDDFAGVARPLLPDGTVREETLRLSRVFRDATVQAAVRRLIEQRQLECPGEQTQVVSKEAAPAPVRVELAAGPFRLRDLRAPSGTTRHRRKVGPYRVLDCLGAGETSALYLAEAQPAAPVVLKVLRCAGASGDDLARFEREARICAGFEHPGLIELSDYGRTPGADGLLYLASPVCGGEPLRALLREPVPLERALGLLEQLADALDAVHRAGVVHRDIRPDNALVLPGDRLKLVDFGIARAYAEEDTTASGVYRTRHATIAGAPAYVAPEAIAGEPCHPRADLYSCGVLAFELLTGAPPFRGEGAAELFERHLYRAAPTLSEARPDRSWCPELEHLVGALLSKLPSQRPTAAQVRDALRGGVRQRSMELLSCADVDLLRCSFEG
ncbi:MAG: serine/threonine-protein kinase [Planctomycetota bacterium]